VDGSVSVPAVLKLLLNVITKAEVFAVVKTIV